MRVFGNNSPVRLKSKEELDDMASRQAEIKSHGELDRMAQERQRAKEAYQQRQAQERQQRAKREAQQQKEQEKAKQEAEARKKWNNLSNQQLDAVEEGAKDNFFSFKTPKQIAQDKEAAYQKFAAGNAKTTWRAGNNDAAMRKEYEDLVSSYKTADGFNNAGKSRLAKLSKDDQEALRTIQNGFNNYYDNTSRPGQLRTVNTENIRGRIEDAQAAQAASDSTKKLLDEGWSQEKINQYVKFTAPDINKENREKQKQTLNTDVHTDNKVVNAVNRALQQIDSIGGSVAGGYNAIIGSHLTPQDTNSGWFAQQNRAEDIRENTVNDIKNPIGQQAYQIGMSLADSAANMGISALTGSEVPTLANFFSSAYGNAYSDAKERGLSNDQARGLGAIAGTAEVLTEKLSLDNLWDLAKNSGKAATRNALTNYLAQVGIEGSEEAASDFINEAADRLVAGNKSSYNTNVKNYVDSGMDEAGAKRQASKDFWQQVGLDTLGGAAGGALFGGIATASGARYRNSEAGRIASGLNNEDYRQIAEGIDTNKSSYLSDYDQQKAQDVSNRAADIADRIDAGEEVSQKEKKNLAKEMLDVQGYAQQAEEQRIAKGVKSAPTQYQGAEAEAYMTGANTDDDLESRYAGSPDLLAIAQKGRLNTMSTSHTQKVSNARLTNFSARTSSGDIAHLNKWNFTQDKDGILSIDTDKGPQAVSSLTGRDNAEQTFLNHIASMDSPKLAQAYVDNYDQSYNISTYTRAADRMAHMGELSDATNLTFDSVLKADTSGLNEKTFGRDTLRAFFDAGREQATQRKAVAPVRGSGQVTFTGDQSALTENENNTLELTRSIARALNLDADADISDSPVRGYLDTKTGRVHVNLGYSDAIRTVGHEAGGEFMQAYNPEGYRAARNKFLQIEIEKRGISYVEDQIAAYQGQYRQYGQSSPDLASEANKTFDSAADEWFNDHFFEFFAKKDNVKKLADEVMKNSGGETVLEKLKDFFTRIGKAIDSFLKRGKLSQTDKDALEAGKKNINGIVDTITEEYGKAVKTHAVEKKEAAPEEPKSRSIQMSDDVQSDNDKEQKNLNTSSSARFSVSVDSEGKELSEDQKKYFSDSRALDRNGNLLVLYHQTNADFTQFDISKKGAGESDYETPAGIFLKPTARTLSLTGDTENAKQMKLYADIQNPLTVDNRSALRSYFIMNSEYEDLVNAIKNNDTSYKEELQKAEDEFEAAYVKWWNENKDNKDAMYSDEDSEAVLRDILSRWTKANDDVGAKAHILAREILLNDGYDGVHLLRDQGGFGKGSVETWIALNPEQVKNTTNEHPTSDPDIRYSLKTAPERKNDFGLVDYDDAQRKQWMSSKKIKIAEDNNDVLTFVNRALAEKNSRAKLYFGVVPDSTAQMVSQKTGVDIKGLNVSISADEIRKTIFHSHGDSKKEALRGQIAITGNDMCDIPKVIAHSDNVTRSNRDYNGRPVLTFEKVINGRLFVTSCTSTRSHDLAVQTMYKWKNDTSRSAQKKKPSTPGNVPHGTLSTTSKTTRGTASLRSESISNVTPSAAKSNTNLTTDKAHSLRVDPDRHYQFDDLETIRALTGGDAEEDTPEKQFYDTEKALGEVLIAANDALKGYKVEKNVTQDLAKRIIKKYHSNISAEELTGQLDTLFGSLQNVTGENAAEEFTSYLRDTAENILEQAGEIDPEDQERYDSFLDLLRRHKIKLNDGQKAEVINRYGSWKDAFGAIGKWLDQKNGNDLDESWGDIVDEAAGLGVDLSLSESGAEHPISIMNALDALKPVPQNIYEGENMEEASLALASEIAQEYFKSEAAAIRDTTTLSAKENAEAVRAAVKRQTDRLKAKTDEFRKAIREEYTEARDKYIQEIRKSQLANQQLANEAAGWQDKVKKLTEEQVELQAKLKARAEKGSIERKYEAIERQKTIQGIRRTGNRLLRWLNQPTNAQHVPDEIAGDVANFVNSVEWVGDAVTAYQDKDTNPKNAAWTARVYLGKDEKGKRKFQYFHADSKEEAERKANEFIVETWPEGRTKTAKQWKQNLAALQNHIQALQNHQLVAENESGDELGNVMANTFDQDILSSMADLIDNTEDLTVRKLDPDRLKQLKQILDAVSAWISRSNKLFANEHYKTVEELADKTISYVKGLKSASTTETVGLTQVKNFLSVDQLEPVTWFSSLGPAGESIYRSFRNGQDTRTFHLNNAMDAFKGMLKESGITEKELKQLSGDKSTLHTFGNQTYTTAQLMSLYVLADREQALNQHIIPGGVIPDKIKRGAKTYNANGLRPHRISQADWKAMTDVLTPEQKKLAKLMRNYLSSTVAEWGNHASKELYGYSKFTEKNYFPIKVWSASVDASDRSVNKDNGNTSIYAVVNMSSSKNLNPHAKNALIVQDIFDVFTDHINQMATYDGYALPILDSMKWFNYRQMSEADETNNFTKQLEDSIKEELSRIGGNEFQKYFTTFLKDVNGANQTDESSSAAAINALVGSYKGAAIGGNLRVVIQQPTAYARASVEISDKYLLKALGSAAQANKYSEKAKKYSGIALWKSWGFYETNIGPSVKAMITGIQTTREAINDKANYLAGKADDLTWGMLWRAAELETQDKHPELKYDSDEFIKTVNDRFSDIIEKTQVVDSTLTKSQIMRRKGFLSKTLTAFMAEPTKSYNMLFRGAKGGKKVFLKAVKAYIFNAILTAIAASVMDAMRDRDKEYGASGWFESYVSHFKENAIDGLNPLETIPIFSDIWETIDNNLIKPALGQSSYTSGSAMYNEGLSTIMSSAKDLIKAVQGTSKKTPYGVGRSVVRGLSQISGVPAYNLWRDFIEAPATTFVPGASDALKTSEGSTYEKLYKAVGSGKNIQSEVEKIRQKKIEEEGSTDEGEKKARSSISSALTKKYKDQLKEYYNSDMTKAAELKNELIQAFTAAGYTRSEASDKIDKWLEE